MNTWYYIIVISYIDSPLGAKSDITCIELNRMGDKIAIGSIDGRANLSKYLLINFIIRI